jgi:hypothetical protein
MRFSYLLQLAFALWIGAGFPAATTEYFAGEASDDRAVQEILDKAAEYCRKLKQAALHFTCTEEIEERIYQPYIISFSRRSEPYTIEKNSYVYHYQFIKDGEDGEDKRILLSENGKAKNEDNAPMKAKRFYPVWLIFGPLEFLSDHWQQYHEYKILREDVLDNRKAVVLEAKPRAPRVVEHLSGRLWIDESDFSILKIEWSQASLGDFEGVREMVQRYGAEPCIQLMAEYFYKKNGIRFPTRFVIQEDYYAKSEKLRKSRTTVEYTDYRVLSKDDPVSLYHSTEHSMTGRKK